MRIDELSLRLPAMSAEDARWIAEQVAKRVGQAAAAQRSLGELRLRIPARSGMSKEQLAAAIAARLLESLR